MARRPRQPSKVTPPVPKLTLRQKQEAMKRFAKKAYRKLSAKGKVSETELREEAYRMYAG